jgi:hypothetical protein
MPNEADLQAIDIAEFDALRREIDNRTQLGNNLFLAQITAFSVAISFFDKVPDLSVALAAISCVLWVLWLDNTEGVFKIGTYIGLVLAPRLNQGGAGLMGWERFRRTLESGGSRAARLLGLEHEHGNESDLPIDNTRQVARYVMLLLGVFPIVLMGVYGMFLLGLSINNPTLWIRPLDIRRTKVQSLRESRGPSRRSTTPEI